MARLAIAGAVLLAVAAGYWYVSGAEERAESDYDRRSIAIFMSIIETKNREPGFEALYGVDARPRTATEALEEARHLNPPPSRREAHQHLIDALTALDDLNRWGEELGRGLVD